MCKVVCAPDVFEHASHIHRDPIAGPHAIIFNGMMS